MKLDKRACRHAANVPLHISLNAGVLYTERVKYLVTAAVKLLGGHRVLAVYFYECERLKANDRMQLNLMYVAFNPHKPVVSYSLIHIIQH